jgi:hypothetical protein
MDGTRDGTNYNSRLTSGFYNAEASPSNLPGVGYGHLIVVKGIDTGWQLAGGYANNTIYTRGWHSSGTFYDWIPLLSSSNYNSYSPTLTGGNASGNWGINITGSSASCSGNSATVTNGVYTTGDQSIAGTKTFTGTISVTAGEGREITTFMPSSYTTDSLVSGHEYGWYNDHWRLGMTRSGGVDGADFVIQWNGARRLSLTSGGNITATGNITAYSDARIKREICTIENALEKTLALRGVTYFRTDDRIKEEDKQKRKVGVVAQEVERILPEVVCENTDGFKSVDYGNITALLIEAIKEQQTTIESLKDRILVLENIKN